MNNKKRLIIELLVIIFTITITMIGTIITFRLFNIGATKTSQCEKPAPPTKAEIDLIKKKADEALKNNNLSEAKQLYREAMNKYDEIKDADNAMLLDFLLRSLETKPKLPEAKTTITLGSDTNQIDPEKQ